MNFDSRLKRIEDALNIKAAFLGEQEIYRQFAVRGIDPDNFYQWMRALPDPELKRVITALEENTPAKGVNYEKMSDEELQNHIECLEKELKVMNKAEQHRSKLTLLRWWLNYLNKYYPITPGLHNIGAFL
jgi:hypothetical protein